MSTADKNMPQQSEDVASRKAGSIPERPVEKPAGRTAGPLAKSAEPPAKLVDLEGQAAESRVAEPAGGTVDPLSMIAEPPANSAVSPGRAAARSAASAALASLRFLFTCWKVNLASAMEYRMSFFLLAGMMIVNNFMWLFFWSLFFTRFPVVNGWELTDVMMLWAVAAGGFGWANMLFGNFHRIAAVVAAGQLDIYLSQPKPVLLHLLASRMSVTAMGDFIFGIAVYFMVGDLSVKGALLFALGLLISGLLLMAVLIIAGCCAFFIGNAEGISQQVFNGFLALTTYPSDIFKGLARALLFSVVPAGFISYLPIGLLRDFSPPFVYGAVFVTVGLTAAGALLFRFGLRRYTSGNAIAMRS